MPASGDAKNQGVPIPDGLVEWLDSRRHPMVIGHVRPDADCLASMFAVALTWHGEGRQSALVSLPSGSLSRRLNFLSDWATPAIATPEDFEKVDGFVAVDTAKKPRCNVDKTLGENWSAGRDVINIDHHVSNTEFGAINWVDGTAASASELVYALICAAGKPITPVTASLLYAGIHSDTVGFSLQTTTSKSLKAAAHLVDCGARVAEIGERLTRSQSKSEFDLFRVIYDNTRLTADGRIAYSTASYDEIIASGCAAADIDDQVVVPRSVGGIRIAVLFTEGHRGRTRLNLRGEGGVNVLTLAKELGGGGHTESAGAIIDGSVQTAVDRVIPMAVALLDGLKKQP